jgi:hypothetical protein
VIIGYIGTIDFGLSALLPREIAKQTGAAGSWNIATQLPELIGKWAKFAILQFPLAIAICGMGAYTLGSPDQFFAGTLGLFGMAAILYPLRIAPLVLTGLQDFRFVGLVQFSTYLVGVIVTVIASRYVDGTAVLVMGWLTQSVLSNAIMWIRLWTVYRSVLPPLSALWSSSIQFSMLTAGAWAWMSSLGVTLAGTSEIMAVGWFDAESRVFSYACTTKLVSVLSPLAVSFGISMIPGLTELRSSGNKPGLDRATMVYAQVVLAISGFFGCTILTINSAFVGCWVGEQRFMGETVTCLVLFGMHLRHFFNSNAIVMFSLSLERPLWILTFVDGCFAYVFAFVIVWMAGPEWAALGPCLSLCFTIPATLILINRQAAGLSVRLIKTWFGWMAVYLMVTSVCYVGIRSQVQAQWWQIVVGGGLAGLIYLLVMAIAGRNTEAWSLLLKLLNRARRPKSPLPNASASQSP